MNSAGVLEDVVPEVDELLRAEVERFIAVGGASVAMDSLRETNAVVYVLEGRLQLDAGGLSEVLETGDCASIESEMALAWSAAGKHRCRVLAVLPGRVEV